MNIFLSGEKSRTSIEREAVRRLFVWKAEAKQVEKKFDTFPPQGEIDE